MPLTVEEYQIGQLYMIARHSHEQTDAGEGVEVVENVACEDPEHGKGQYTEKRIHLSSRLPYWIQSFLPKIFYVTEKAWNYYPFTITEYTCLDLEPDTLNERVVEFVDIAYDEVSPKHYKEEEDVRYFQSQKTGRGPLVEGWRDTVTPIMCSYKMVQVSFEVWGLQTRAEDLIHRSIREILLLGHRQAFAWIDDWYGMTLDDVRMYEEQMQRETNTKVVGNVEPDMAAAKDIDEPHSADDTIEAGSTSSTPAARTPTTPNTPCTPKSKSWFSWS